MILLLADLHLNICVELVENHPFRFLLVIVIVHFLVVLPLPLYKALAILGSLIAPFTELRWHDIVAVDVVHFVVHVDGVHVGALEEGLRHGRPRHATHEVLIIIRILIARILLLFDINGITVFSAVGGGRALLFRQRRHFRRLLALPENGDEGELPDEVGEEAAEEPEPGVDGRDHRNYIAFYILMMNCMIGTITTLNVPSPEEADKSEKQEIEAHDGVNLYYQPQILQPLILGQEVVVAIAVHVFFAGDVLGRSNFQTLDKSVEHEDCDHFEERIGKPNRARTRHHSERSFSRFVAAALIMDRIEFNL
mgnify:CR=1 FL=1